MTVRAAKFDGTYPGRTNKQPLRWRCRNPECRTDGKPTEFESDYAECRKCGANGFPYVELLTLVHLLIPDVMGPIRGQTTRYKLACDPTRGVLATTDNNEAATDQIGAVTCPGCKAVATKQGITKPLGRSLKNQADEG